MARFKVGQKLVCIKKVPKNWKDGLGKIKDGPIYLEEVTCAGYNRKFDYGVILAEYPHNKQGYNEARFEPIMDISELTEILEAVPEKL